MFNPTDNSYAYLGMNLPISSANIDRTGYMLNARVKYTAAINMVSISTANTNLDGTGTITTLMTGGSSGTLIKRIIIKAQGNTTQGMIRLFYNAIGTYWLMQEIPVPAVTQGAMD